MLFLVSVPPLLMPTCTGGVPRGVYGQGGHLHGGEGPLLYPAGQQGALVLQLLHTHLHQPCSNTISQGEDSGDSAARPRSRGSLVWMVRAMASHPACCSYALLHCCSSPPRARHRDMLSAWTLALPSALMSLSSLQVSCI